MNRTIPAALLAAVTLTAAAPAVASAVHARPAPATVARTATLHGAPEAPGLRIDFVGVQWRGPRTGGAIRMRRAGRWSAWRALRAADQHAPGRRASELVAAGGASAYQVRLPAGARDGRATAMNTTASRHAARAAVPPPHRWTARPCVRTRAQWGADESLRFDAAGQEIWTPAFFTVQKLTVHHTATEGGGADPAALVRAIYRYHAVDLGYGDIGYQLLVDESGCVYEGRFSGADRVAVYGPRSTDGTPQAVNAGHVAGFNAGNVGVALLGDFTDHAPTAAARRGLVRALAWVARASRLDPLGSGVYVNPITGAAKDLPTISGHRDWLATECPGAMLYPLLPAIREDVARMLGR